MTFREQVEKKLAGLSKKERKAFAWRCAVRALPFLGGEGHFDYWKKEDRQRYLFSVFYAIDFVNYAAAAYAAADAAYAAADTANHFKIDLTLIILQDLQTIKTKQKPQLSISTYGQIWDNFQAALKKENCEYWGKWYQQLFENNFKFDQKEVEKRINLPKEIKDQGAARVAAYLEQLQEVGGEYLNESRIIILGEKGAGKTCVARKLIDPKADMTTVEESTAGVDTHVWSLEAEQHRVNIWDFAGHTVTHAVHQFFLSERCLYIMVYDGRTEDRNRIEYWLDHMKNYGGQSQAIILVNERDQHKINLPINYLKEKYPIAGCYSFNVKEDAEALATFRAEVANFIRTNPSWRNQEIPKSYYLVKEELEKRFNKNGNEPGEEHIKKKDFIAIAEKHQVEEPEKLLLDLHYLGVSLWYEDMDDYQTLVLNPEWISQGVYKIINWVNDQKKHALLSTDFPKVFADVAERFPADK